MHDEILDRISNWRRFYRATQRIHAVPYYQPPPLGNVVDGPSLRFVKIPSNMADAIHLESCWRNLNNLAIKYYLKWAYIERMPHHVIWRKLKHHGVRIRNSNDQMLYDRHALGYFGRVVG